ncbi:MAG: flavin reductase family protein [Actinomycetota bacterium]|nr:flavin reductase family protein [Actinomycetota bacterium]
MDAEELRRVMSHWATGVAVVTSRGDEGPRGATTNALTSLSLDPPLVLVCLDNGSNTLAAARASRRFCINVLAVGQEEIARRFATKESGEEKLAGLPHDLADGVPVLHGVLAWLVCEVEQEVAGGDHEILIGRPLETGGDEEAQPLVFFGARYL